MTLAVFVFIMALVNLFKLVDFFARGVSGVLLLKVFSYGMPSFLIFAIPISVLGATYLFYSRMAADHELIAMKSCGISMWQAVRMPMLISLVLSVFCIYINCDIAPRSHFARREIAQVLKTNIDTPLKLLDEGRFVDDIPGLKIYIEKREEKNLENIIIYEFGDSGIERTIRAETGTISIDKENAGLITVDLFDVRIDQADTEDPGDLGKTRHVTAGHYPIVLDVDELMRSGTVWKKRADLTMFEILTALTTSITAVMPNIIPEEIDTMRTALLVEVNTRLALSMSSFVFILLGAALGLKIHRKESSIGLGLTLVLVFVFYFFIMIADSLVSYTEYRPYLIVWLPVMISSFIGTKLINRN